MISRMRLQLALQAADVLVGERPEALRARGGERRRSRRRRPNSSRVCAVITTGPAGVVRATLKSAGRWPTRLTRTRSPTTTGRPSRSRPSDRSSDSVGGWIIGTRTTALGRLRGDRPDLDRLVDRRAGVLAGHAVDLDAAPPAVGAVGRHEPADRPAAADELDDVADLQAEPRRCRPGRAASPFPRSRARASVTRGVSAGSATSVICRPWVIRVTGPGIGSHGKVRPAGSPRRASCRNINTRRARA